MVYQENASDSTVQKLGGSLLNALLFVVMIIVVTVILVLLFKYRCMNVRARATARFSPRERERERERERPLGRMGAWALAHECAYDRSSMVG